VLFHDKGLEARFWVVDLEGMEGERWQRKCSLRSSVCYSTLLKNLIGRSNDDERDINSLNINGICTTNPTKIATEFNNYFTDIAHSLAKNIPNSNSTIEQNMIPSKVDSFGLTF